MSRCPECGDGLNDEERADLYARLEQAERQRDELLAALKWAMSILDAQNACDSGCGPHCSNFKARALIARIDNETKGTR